MMGESGIAILLSTAVRQTCPLLLAAMGGILSERSGVINIALEGLMLTGAFVGIWVGSSAGSAAGVIAALVAGGLIGAVHLVLTQRFRMHHIVSGVALNLLALHSSTYLLRALYHQASPPRDAKLADPLSLFGFVLAAAVLPLMLHGLLYGTSFGLRLRAVGENAAFAMMAGVEARALRAWGVVLSGVLAAGAGAYLSMALVGRFTDDMVGGRGFIALAAVVCGRWTPLGAALACCAFGLFDALQLQMQGVVRMPPEFLRAAPYLLTIAAAALFQSRPPAGLGQPEEE